MLRYLDVRIGIGREMRNEERNRNDPEKKIGIGRDMRNEEGNRKDPGTR